MKKPPYTFNQPEKFDQHWGEKPGMYENWKSPWLWITVICGATIWGVLIAVLVKYL